MGISASIFWALTPPLVKLCIDIVEDPFIINSARLASSLIGYAIVMAINPIKINVSTHALAFIVLSAIIGPGLGDIAYVASIGRLGPNLAVLISYQYILIAQVLSFLILHYEKGLIGLILTPIALLGIYIAFKDRRDEGIRDVSGILLALIASFLWASSLTIISYLVNNLNIEPFTISLIRTLVLTPLITSIGITRTKYLVKMKHLGLRNSLALIISGMTSYFGGVVLFITAVDLCGGVLVAITNALTPVTTQLISPLITREVLGKNKLVGSLLVSIAIGLTAISYVI